MTLRTAEQQLDHDPVCPPESRCAVCWSDDDEVIKALVIERNMYQREVAWLRETIINECDACREVLHGIERAMCMGVTDDH